MDNSIETLEPEKVDSFGTILDQWTYKSCLATVGVGKAWAAIYNINSDVKGEGYASELLLRMKNFYQGKDKYVVSFAALNDTMRRLLVKHQIKEFKE